MTPEQRRKRWRIPLEQRDEIVAAYLDGEKLAVIALMFGVSDATILNIAREYGAVNRRTTRSTKKQLWLKRQQKIAQRAAPSLS